MLRLLSRHGPETQQLHAQGNLTVLCLIFFKEDPKSGNRLSQVGKSSNCTVFLRPRRPCLCTEQCKALLHVFRETSLSKRRNIRDFPWLGPPIAATRPSSPKAIHSHLRRRLAMHGVFSPLGRAVNSQWILLVVLGLLAYMALVRLLRHQRAKSMPRRYGLDGRASFAKMTTDQAQAILKDLTELEFPKIFGFSIIFALFKVGSFPG